MRQPVLPRRRSAVVARAAAVAATLLLISAPMAFADTVVADGDTLTATADHSVDLGRVLPNTVFTHNVGLTLTCTGTSHLDAGASVGLTASTTAFPAGGGLSADDVTIPAPSGWPADGSGCASPAQTASATSLAIITAPPTNGDYTYILGFSRRVSNGDVGGVTVPGGGLDIAFTLHVGPANTAPQLQLPSSFTVEGNEANGATVTWTATASDAEDSPAPTPTCSPASGSHFGLGTTTVSCSVTDSGGLTASGTFDVTVVDTTAPTIGTNPEVDAVTTNPSGAPVTFATPLASDIVDPKPSVACSPASGSTFPVGSTSVTCTATDASGNAAGSSFQVVVRLAQVSFDAPIGPSNVVASNGSRTIPVKANVSLDGAAVTTGDVRLVIAACGGTAAGGGMPLTWNGARWVANLDTSSFGAGCWQATVTVNGLAVGSFQFGAVASSGPRRT